jgi:malate dehydrogenase
MNSILSTLKNQRKAFFLAGSASLLFGYSSYKSFYDKTRMASQSGIQQNNQKIMKICVTGAAGNVGTSLIPMLASGEVFGNDVKVHLKLLDVPAHEHTLKGMQLELQDGAYPLLYGVEIGSNPRKLFRDIDLGVFIGGYARHPGMERSDLLQINGQIFKDQGVALNENAKRDVKCLVVANPANTNCAILQHYAPEIPNANFTSLSRLDQNRAVGQLSQKTGVAPDRINNVIIWGNHSNTLFPSVRYGTINGLDIREAINNDSYIDSEFIKKVQNRGNEILETKKAPATISGAKAISDHLRDWYFGIPQGQMISMGVASDGSYGVPKGLICSMPVVTRNFDYKIVKGLEITRDDANKFRKSVNELVEERDIALGTPMAGRG